MTLKLYEWMMQGSMPVYTSLSKIGGGIIEGIYLSHLLDQGDKLEDGWLRTSYEDIYDALRFTKSEYRSARQKLLSRNLITEKRIGIPCRIYTQLNREQCNLHLAGEHKHTNTVADFVRINAALLNSLSRAGWKRAKSMGIHADYVSYADVFLRDKGVCGLCGASALHSIGQRGDDTQFDHVIPLSTGGLHTLDNIQVSHAVCNLRKGAH